MRLNPILYLIVIWSPLLLSTQGKLISRVNYGVFFRSKGFIVTEANQWQHTYRIVLPKFNMKPIEHLECMNTIEQSLNGDCALKNFIIAAFNDRIADLQKAVRSIRKKAIKTVKTEMDLNLEDEKSKSRIQRDILYPLNVSIQESKPQPLKSRSKRGLLDFVGDIANGLFGVATDSEIDELKSHIRKLVARQHRTDADIKTLDTLLNTYITKSNSQFKTLFDAVKDNHQLMSLTRNETKIAGQKLYASRQEVTKMMLAYITKSTMGSRIERQFSNMLRGIHSLVQRKLDPHLITVSMLRKTLATIRKTLQRDYPLFRICNKHPAFYYNQPVLFS